MRILALMLWALLLPTIAAAQTTIRLCYINANGGCTPVGTSNPFPTTATISGFAPGTTAGTPITASIGGATGTLPAGAIVVATNTGTTNAAYCKLGAAATTSDQYIAPNGGWFAFTVGSATQLTCATSTSTTTVNMVGGSGIPTGTGGGGGGGGSGGSVTQGTSPWIVAGGGTAGAPATGVVTVQGIASGTVIPVSLTSTTITGTVAATQSGTWTVQPGNTANTTPWLVTLSGTNNIATVTSLSQFAGNAIALNAGAASAGTLRVVTSSDSPEIALLTTINTNIQAGAGATAAAVPASAIYMGVNVGGNLTGFAPGTAGTASTQVVTVQGIASMTPLLVTPTTNAPINVAQINGVTPLMGSGNTGTGSPRVTLATDQLALAAWGLGATGATAPVGAQLSGCRSASAAPTELTDGQMNSIQCSLGGKVVNLPYSIKETVVSGGTAAMTGTTSTSVIGAAGGSLRNYITGCTFSNSHATVGTMILLQDGSGGTTLWAAPAASVFGGAHVLFPTPIKTTANTALFTANVTTGANTFVYCTGYTGI